MALKDIAIIRDFLTMLPATLSFEDDAGSEKIGFLTRDLSTEAPRQLRSPGG